jgi:hypothetical protein
MCPVATTEACAKTPSYQRDVAPVLNTYCNNCHNAEVDGGPWPLGGYENVHHWKELMVIDLMSCRIAGIVKGHPMPPADAGTPLPATERDVMVQWLLCGAPNN